MRKIFIALGLSVLATTSFACQVQAPTTEVQRYLDALPGGVAPLYNCQEKPEEACHCLDMVSAWDEMMLVDEMDETTQIYTGKKILKVDPAKLQAKAVALQLLKDAEIAEASKRKLILIKLQNVKKSDLTSNAKTVDILMEVIELLKE